MLNCILAYLMAFLLFLVPCWQYYGRKKLNKIIKHTFIELFIKFLHYNYYIYFLFFNLFCIFTIYLFPSMPDFPILSISKKNSRFFFNYYFLLFKFSVSLISAIIFNIISDIFGFILKHFLLLSWKLCSFTFHISSF